MASRTKRAGEAAVDTFDSVLAGVSRVTKSARVCLDGELMGEIEALHEELQAARDADAAENRLPQAPAVAERIVHLTEQARASEVEFTFSALGRRAWRDLAAEHPPSEKDKTARADFNTDTFPIAAMAATCIAPTGATVEKFEQLADQLTDGQWNKLWAACHTANTGGADVPLSVAAFALARGTETSSARRGSTARPAASS